MIPEGSVQTSKGGEQPTVLPNYDACEPQQQPARHDITRGAVVVHIHTLAVTNSFLIRFKTHSTKGNLSFVLET